MIQRELNLVTHTMLIVAVMVYPTMVPHRFTYCAMPHMNTSLGPARVEFQPGILLSSTSKEKKGGSCACEESREILR
jgi:hypothetical protein